MAQATKSRADANAGIRETGQSCCVLVTGESRKKLILINILWILQALVVILFLFTGGIKLVLPLSRIAISLPWLFPPFVGVADVLGMLGLILPGGVVTSLIPVFLPIGSCLLLCEELYQRDDRMQCFR